MSGGRGLKRFSSISESAAKLFINPVLIESLTSRHVTVALHRLRACGSHIIKRKKYGFVRAKDLDQSQRQEDQSKTSLHWKPVQICGPPPVCRDWVIKRQDVMKDGAIGLKRTITPASTAAETGPLLTGTPKNHQEGDLKGLDGFARCKLEARVLTMLSTGTPGNRPLLPATFKRSPTNRVPEWKYVAELHSK